MDQIRHVFRLLEELWLGRPLNQATDDPNHWARDAMLKHKQESVRLALRARVMAATVIAVLLPILNPTWPVLYYEFLIACFVAVGLAYRCCARTGSSMPGGLVLIADLVLLTVAVLAPNPLHETEWPMAMRYRFENFVFYFVLLAAATLMYSWRSIVALGVGVVGIWLTGFILIEAFANNDPKLTAAAQFAFEGDLARILDPNNARFGLRLQEVVVFLLVSVVLALGVCRSQALLFNHAESERQRANLARHFSPNMVEELSKYDAPLRDVRSQEVAVLFVDIVGFTRFTTEHPPSNVIETLREFHARMEKEVFRHGGTLDKFLGDGLMATFGTPFTAPLDAQRALMCARAMMASIEQWNETRQARGEVTIKVSFGLNYGPVILGDIGEQRIEFAAVGNTVNVASRLEAMTRQLNAVMIASDTFIDRVREQAKENAEILNELTHLPPQIIKGLSEPVPVWMIPRS